MNLSAVNASTAETSALIPSAADLSTDFAPSMKGLAFFMNLERFSPISGNPLLTPAPNPPMILPTKSPIAYPTCERSFEPSPTNHDSPGIYFNAPATTRMPVIPAKTTANASIPSNAPEAPPEKLLRITVVAVSTNNNSDSPVAVANVELGSKSLSKYKIPARAAITKVITPKAIIAFLLIFICFAK